ncbi:hypothetical protein [Alkalicoccus daliensis]|uniref:Protease complex subunit PrcB family protein n=1 Tax=Alkalicoccus daliensis TaxID=745820 RepID=A0A1G9ZAE5_9BACI|nr:hypothetical protein [Alkalicoccus daliensis]SDN18045.1 hypothetical protein SAMN04488053_10113 [Alkalicoccus daliensis]
MKYTCLLITGLIFLLPGCGPPTDFEEGTLLETNRTAPDEGIGEQGVHIAEDAEEFRDFWESYGYRESPPDIDFNEHTAILMHTGESSCEKEVAEIHTGGGSLTVDVAQEEGPCNDIYYPRSFVITVSQETMQEVEEVIFEEETFPLEE